MLDLVALACMGLIIIDIYTFIKRILGSRFVNGYCNRVGVKGQALGRAMYG